MYQMGVIYYWLNDESPEQSRTRRALELSASAVGGLIGLTSLPLTKAIRRPVVELLEVLTAH
jgi:Tetracyclin repressor-like, C-terminal domain